MRSSASQRRSFATVVAVCAALLAVLLVGEPRSAAAQNLTVEQVNEQLGIGVNLGNALEGPREGDWGMTIEADFFPTIADAGFGHVRVPIRFSGYAANTPPYAIPDGIDPTVPNADNLWDRIDWVIANAEANNLYVILDLHHYDELFEDVAGERDRFLAIWQQISQRYQNASSRVLFEVLNEPHGQFNGNPGLLNDLLDDVLGVVRVANPTRPVLVGPAYWNSISALDDLDLPNDPNLIVSVHFYEPFGFTHQGAEWLNSPPPTPANFEADLINFGAGWGNWSWDSTAVSTASSLRVTYDRQWAGLGFGRQSLADPASLTVTVSGASELSVRCAAAGGAGDVEVDRIITTAAAQMFQLDMASCSNQTEMISFMMASPTFDQLNFSQIELCEADGSCTGLIESGTQAIDAAFEQAAQWAQQNNRPINVGEFGAYSAGGQSLLSERAEWTEIVRTAGERHGFSMSYWEFGAGFGVYDRNASAWITPLLDALGVQPSSGAFCDGQRVTINMNTNGGNGLGTPQSDVILGTPGADVITAGSGADVICAGGGNDTINAGFGGDRVFGEAGNDSINGQGDSDFLVGGHGVDTITGGDQADRIYGDNFGGGAVGNNDFLYGESGSDLIYGGPGNDTIDGGIGNDRLFGQQGQDTIDGGNGDDKIYGGSADDVLSGGNDRDKIWGETGHDVISGNGGSDFWLDGGDHNDKIYGRAGNDVIRGGDGRDRVYGQSGNDDVRAQAGDDWVTDGGPGNDSCQVAPGSDVAAINCES